MPNIVKLIELLLVNPALSCTTERSFSTARGLKTWLRSLITNKRFNFLSILNIHKDMTDELNVVDIGNEFYHYMKIVINTSGQLKIKIFDKDIYCTMY